MMRRAPIPAVATGLAAALALPVPARERPKREPGLREADMDSGNCGGT